ncbi:MULTISPECIES: hypothetical protein [Bacillaceae]|uniref:hypothetical protein n=1 Tax=Bacillaceae TaxID=186817 RepID=UPI003000E822
MFKIFIFVLIAVTLIMLSIFMDGMIDLYKQEEEKRKNTVRDGLEGYLDQVFGFGRVRIFKTLIDADGSVRYVVYLPKYEWFKAPTYTWYEVYLTNKGFRHNEFQA